MNTRLETNYAIAKLLSESNNLVDVFPHIIKLLIRELKWEVGIFWEFNENENALIFNTYWAEEDSTTQDFTQESKSIKFPLGIGLPGRVLEKEKAEWKANITTDDNFPRTKVAKKVGINTGLCFPLTFNHKKFGVLEFYTKDIIECKPDVLDMMQSVCNQLTAFIERVNSGEALRNSEKLKSAMVNAALDCIITMDENGKIIEFNPASEKTFGYAADYAKGNDLSKLIIPERFRKAHNAGVQRFLQTGVGRIINKRIEVTAIRKDGIEFPIELIVTHTKMNNKSVLTAFIRDLTMRNALERSKNLFFSNVSNEFQTPLHLILGPASDAIHDPINLLDKIQLSRLMLIYRNAKRLLKLSNSLLDFSLLEAGKLVLNYEIIDIKELTQQICSYFLDLIKAGGLEIEINIEPNCEFIAYADKVLWSKIILNLISNAFKYTLNGRITLSLTKINNRLEFKIKDTGIGISSANLNNIFMRFARIENTKGRSQEGAGIGLALTSELIQLHQGTISVNSIENKGSEFRIEFPDHLEQVANKEPPAKLSASTQFDLQFLASLYVEEALSWIPNSSISSLNFPNQSVIAKDDKPHILIAEENSDMRHYLTSILENNYILDFCNDGQDAFEKAQKHPYDLTLSGLILSSFDGITLVEQFRANHRTKHMPVILLSSRLNENERLKSLEKGADDYLSKPFSTEELLIRIKTHIDLSRTRKKLHESIQTRTLELQNEVMRHQQTALALSKSEESYRTLAKIAPVGIVHTDINGDIIYINKRGTELLNMVHVDIAKLNWQKCLLDNSINPDGSTWHNAQNGKVKNFILELSFERDDQKKYLITETVAEVDGNQNVIGFISTITDITEIKYLEQSRLQAIKLAEEQQRKRAEDAEKYQKRQEYFIDTMCHELRNPLNGIYGSVTLIKDSLQKLTASKQPSASASSMHLSADDDELQLAQIRESIDSIEKCAMHQKIITDDVLNLSKLESGKIELNLENFNLNNLIKNILSMLESEIKNKNLTLKLLLPSSDLSLISDPKRIAQILINLLSNSIKFTQQGGEITIAISVVDQSVENMMIEYKVIDNGIGMTKEESVKLFDRFAQANKRTYSEYGGSGLGLSISKNLVELLGGAISVQSEKGKGSCFSFTIKAKKGFVIQATSTPVIKKSPKKIDKRFAVLIVEDNTINQKILSRILEANGYSCHLANDGIEALRILKSTFVASYTGLPIKVVLMDIEMPKMNGIEATIQIRKFENERRFFISQPLLIIGLSGNAREEYVKKALDSGMNEYLVKPYDKDTLLDVITKLVQSRPQNPIKFFAPISARADFIQDALSSHSSINQVRQ